MKLAAASGLRLIPDTAAVAGFVGKGIAYFGTNLSPALLGVGYIVGLNIGIVVLFGGDHLLEHRDSALQRVLPRTTIRRSRAQLAGADAERRGRRDLGRRRSATSASARCWSAASGR